MTRFSLSTLIFLVCLCAVGSAALANANAAWAGAMILIGLFTAGAAIMGAFILRGRDRCLSAGYALFAGGYFALAFAPGLSDAFLPVLGTTRLLLAVEDRVSSGWEPEPGDSAAEREMLADRIARIRKSARSANDPSLKVLQQHLTRLDQATRAQRLTGRHPDSFQRVGHCLSAILAGLAGGAVALRLHAKRWGREGPVQPPA